MTGSYFVRRLSVAVGTGLVGGVAAHAIGLTPVRSVLLSLGLLFTIGPLVPEDPR